MHLFFIDEAGTISSSKKIVHKHFILGGLVVPEEQWFFLQRDFFHLCKIFRVNGEVKWRFFGQQKGHEEKGNPLSHLDLSERDELRRRLLTTVTKYHSIKIIASISHLPTLYSLPNVHNPEQIYGISYKPLTERFQYHLQDLSRKIGSKIYGIIVCDHRSHVQDKCLRNLHFDLLNYNKSHASRMKYGNLVESLFLSPSHHSLGIQFADLISGSLFRYFEHQDDRWYKLLEPSIRTSSNGELSGYGLIKVPKGIWKESDAESRDHLEPAIDDAVSAYPPL